MKIRREFQLLKKNITDEYIRTGNVQNYKKKMADYSTKLQQAELDFKLKRVQIAAPHREVVESAKLVLNETDKNALETYYNLIEKTKPKMIKEKRSDEYDYDFDFEVDMNNYDPWEEYKMIYKDLFAKGRSYFILKAIPEWRFLQVGRPVTKEDETVSPYNPKRFNNRDSIFTILTVDRYFHERERKEGTYKGKSQAIRI